MTDKATPEALKHATGLEQFAELLPAYGFDPKSLKDAAAELRRQHARIAELEAEIAAVGAGGVQALSAGPNGWESVIDETRSGLQDSEPSAFDNSGYRAFAETVLDAVEEGLSALAASPTPPALSAAPAAAWANPHAALAATFIPGQIWQYRPRADPTWTNTRTPNWLPEFEYRRHPDEAASPTPPAEQQAQPVGQCVICGSDEPFTGTCGSGDPRALCKQAAPKAAPWLVVHQNKLLADALAACIMASGIVRKDVDGFTLPQLLHFAKDLQSMLEAAPKAAPGEPIAWTPGSNPFKDWCTQWFGPDSDDDYLAKAVFNLPPMAQVFREATPQQEAQERVYLVNTGEVRNGLEMYERHEKPVPLADFEVLYTAPQPAPAPLSRERVKEIMRENGYDGASAQHRADFINGIRRAEVAHGISAALAAQGGKA